MQKAIIAIVVILILGVGGYFSFKYFKTLGVVPEQEVADTTPSQNEGVTPPVDDSKTTLGTSTAGHAITAYHYGKGSKEIVFVGGIHGGYSWNTVLVARELMSYLEQNPQAVPANVKVTVIPVLNPDGLAKVVGTTENFTSGDIPSSQTQVISGRFNGNNVDWNRNFDCDWQSTGKWQNRNVSGGSKAFSEPESAAVAAYVAGHRPSAVVVWYSAAGGVFASSCHNGVSAETSALTKKYAEASGYKAYEDFDFYEITGDMVNWLAKEGIPAISVLLTTHESVEWDKNLKGVQALLQHYAN